MLQNCNYSYIWLFETFANTEFEISFGMQLQDIAKKQARETFNDPPPGKKALSSPDIRHPAAEGLDGSRISRIYSKWFPFFNIEGGNIHLIMFDEALELFGFFGPI